MPNSKDTPTDDAAKGSSAPQPSSAPPLDDAVAHADEAERRSIEEAFAADESGGVRQDGVVPNKKSDVETIDDSTADQESAVIAEGSDEAVSPPKSRFKRILSGYWRHKLWTLPMTVLLIVGVLAAVPVSRYAVAATFMTQDVAISVTDQDTKQPVGSAIVTVDGVTATTDSEGRASVKVKVGDRTVSVSKKYYSLSTGKLFVPIGGMNAPAQVTVKATGRQVPLAVVNKISGKPLEDVLIKAAGTEVKTDKDGKAVLVLPADKPKLDVALSGKGFNELKTTLTVAELPVASNTFQITPSGKVYFLSKQSGKIDVVKTDLDGTNRQTIVAGTGREEERNTILLASRDWKYLAMLSRRDSEKAKLYLIDTVADKMTTMDEGDANFQLVGWSGHTFAYSVIRNKIEQWQPNKYAIKSYNAVTNKLNTLEQTQAEGDQYSHKFQNLSGVYLIGDKAIYSTEWLGSYSNGTDSFADKNDVIRSVSVNGSDKKDLKTFPADKFSSYSARSYGPDEIYFFVYSHENQKPVFYEYEDGLVKLAAIDQDDFYNKVYPTYLQSPSGKKVFWSEQRDGKGTFFIGNQSGEDQKQVAVLAEHQVYGWYSDDYILVSKKGSELFILPADGSKVAKVTDYHRPDASFRGYGGGYGGL